MRAVLIGADLMYRQDGRLVPIEINTNTAWDANNRLEDFNDCFDYDSFKAFLDLHNIEEIWVDGLIAGYLIRYFGEEKGLNIVRKSERELEEAEDQDGLLLLRTSYSEEALVDAFCRDKNLFLEAIKALEFGCEFILKDGVASWRGEITNLPDNGDYPNLIVKYRYPYYNRTIYPKLVKVSSQEELVALLESDEVPEDYLVMPFYYNADHLYDEDSGRRMKLFRHLSMFALVNGSLEAVPVGTYTKLCGDLTNVQCEYNEFGVLDSESRKAFLNYWLDPSSGDVLVEPGDLILMADDTWKPVEELIVGDMVKSLDVPSRGEVNIKNHVEDYNISFEELQESSSYSNNAVSQISLTTGVITKINLRFTDGTDWWDTADSSYPTIDPEDGTVWFRTLDMLEVGDKIILLKADDLENPIYVEKEIEEISRTRGVVDGYQLVVEGSHLFITKYSSEAVAYISIEHNSSTACVRDSAVVGSPCRCNGAAPITCSYYETITAGSGRRGFPIMITEKSAGSGCTLTGSSYNSMSVEGYFFINTYGDEWWTASVQIVPVGSSDMRFEWKAVTRRDGSVPHHGSIWRFTSDSAMTDQAGPPLEFFGNLCSNYPIQFYVNYYDHWTEFNTGSSGPGRPRVTLWHTAPDGTQQTGSEYIGIGYVRGQMPILCPAGRLPYLLQVAGTVS